MGVLDFLKRKKEEDDIPDFGPATDFGTEPFPTTPGMPSTPGMPPAAPAPLPPPVDPFAPSSQSYPLSTTPSFPTPASVGPATSVPQSDVTRELEKINHKLDLISERISKMEQTLDFMQRYTYANR